MASEKSKSSSDVSQSPAHQRALNTFREKYFPEIWYLLENWLSFSKAKVVLDVGSARGLFAEALGRQDWQVTCVDPSISALMETKARFEEAGLEGRFEQTEPVKLPFSDGSFDAVIAVNALEFSPKPVKLVREIGRCLTPGGRAVIVTFNKYGPWAHRTAASVIRPEAPIPARFYSRREFGMLLKTSHLRVEAVRSRAAYFPSSRLLGRFKLPIPGAFVALCSRAPREEFKDSAATVPRKRKLTNDPPD